MLIHCTFGSTHVPRILCLIELDYSLNKYYLRPTMMPGTLPSDEVKEATAMTTR